MDSSAGLGSPARRARKHRAATAIEALDGAHPLASRGAQRGRAGRVASLSPGRRARVAQHPGNSTGAPERGDDDEFGRPRLGGRGASERRRSGATREGCEERSRLTGREDRRLSASLDRVAGRAQPAPRHPGGTRGSTTSASTTLIRVEGRRDIQTKVMTTLFALFAEVERGLISERTCEGPRLGRAGPVLGRPAGWTRPRSAFWSNTNSLKRLRLWAPALHRCILAKPVYKAVIVPAIQAHFVEDELPRWFRESRGRYKNALVGPSSTMVERS